jgi:hypothetical protein
VICDSRKHERSPTMLPIPGTLSPEHLKENLAALEIELSEEEFRALQSTGLRPADRAQQLRPCRMSFFRWGFPEKSNAPVSGSAWRSRVVIGGTWNVSSMNRSTEENSYRVWSM